LRYQCNYSVIISYRSKYRDRKRSSSSSSQSESQPQEQQQQQQQQQQTQPAPIVRKYYERIKEQVGSESEDSPLTDDEEER